MIDTHAHLYWQSFDDDRNAVIERAFKQGVEKIINIATDLDTAQQCIVLAEEYEGLYATAGIHPNDAGKFDDRTIPVLKEFLQHPKVVAIGEIGLDFYRDWCAREIQERVFREQIRLAKETGRPIIIHNRDAGREIIDVLKSEGFNNLKGVFHCFSEDLKIAQEILEIGFFISFTGNLTFKKSRLPEVAMQIPLEKLLLETDCPFLSPEPKRGRRNEPANVGYIAEKLAEYKNLPLEELVIATTINAVNLFGLGEKDMV